MVALYEPDAVLDYGGEQVAARQKRFERYAISSGSPGPTLLSNYGLRQVPCGPPDLVVIYGPSFGVICASPNGRVAAGSYAVNTNTLTDREPAPREHSYALDSADEAGVGVGCQRLKQTRFT
jgi:hypothetical protein